MNIRKLAQQVYEQQSTPLKNCWQLHDLEDFDRIFYAPGSECSMLAAEMQQQLEIEHQHAVTVHSLQWLITHGESDEFPSDFSAEAVLSLNLLCDLATPKTLLVCDENLQGYLRWLNRKISMSLRICTPRIFYLGMLDKKVDQQYLQSNFPLTSGRTLKQVSYIAVLSSSDSVWYKARQLYESYLSENPYQQVELLFVSDGDDTFYEKVARYHFMRICAHTDCSYIRTVKLQDLFNSNLDGRCLWVLPQIKSYLISSFPEDYYYILDSNDVFGLWGMYSRPGKEVVLRDVNKLAKQEGVSSTHDEGVCQRFLEQYKPKNFANWRWKRYWLHRALCRFCSM